MDHHVLRCSAVFSCDSQRLGNISFIPPFQMLAETLKENSRSSIYSWNFVKKKICGPFTKICEVCQRCSSSFSSVDQFLSVVQGHFLVCAYRLLFRKTFLHSQPNHLKDTTIPGFHAPIPCSVLIPAWNLAAANLWLFCVITAFYWLSRLFGFTLYVFRFKDNGVHCHLEIEDIYYVVFYFG